MAKESLVSSRAKTIDGELAVPPDKSISHRAVLISALSNGPCVIRNFLEGEDCRGTAGAMQQLGVQIEYPEPGTLVVHGTKGQLTKAFGPIDCGNSGTTMRLLSGILAAQDFDTTLTGDASLSRRPMRRVAEPLRRMGADISGAGTDLKPPLTIRGSSSLAPVEYRLPVASAQVKSAVLLAGLLTRGTTATIEQARTRDHTERMLEHFLVKLDRRETWEHEKNPKLRRLVEIRTSIDGGQIPESMDFTVPGDISSAAFWLVAAACQPGSRLLVKDVGLNPTRTGVIDVLVRMGARIREVIETSLHGEPMGNIDIKGSRLNATTISGAEIPNVIDELPVLAVAASLANGTTIIKDAAELRVKETDRIAAVASNLRAMGVQVEEFPDGMAITGRDSLAPARLPCHHDHRIAMAFAVAGLFADGETVVEDTACVNTSYPGFASDLERIRKGLPAKRRFPGFTSSAK
jgi:3-phosphoshikimate 1-carboxyvinyltransferase